MNITALGSRSRLHRAGRPSGARGGVLVLPGGGYGHLSRHEGPDAVEFLTSHGVAAAWLEYPVASTDRPTPLAELPLVEALLALARLRGAGADDEPFEGPIAVLGFSAGGHLAGTAATATDAELARAAAAGGVPVEKVRRPDAAVLCYPVVSMVQHPHLGSRRNLLGADASQAVARWVSVEERIDAATPPTFLWHTADDDSVPVEHTLLAAATLCRFGIPTELHVYPHGSHGLGLAHGEPGAEEWSGALLRWLGDQGIG